MKTLYLVRHAKSDWGNEAIRDIDRHLNERGYADAYMMSSNFAKKRELPQLLVSSSAIRALSTALIFARNFKYPEHQIRINPNLYECHSSDLLKEIYQLDDSLHSVMLFAHNPTLTNVFADISDSYVDNIPTCGIIGIRFAVETWAGIKGMEGETFVTEFPKEFKM